MHKIDISYVLLAPLAFVLSSIGMRSGTFGQQRLRLKERKLGEEEAQNNTVHFSCVHFFCDKFVSREPANFWELSLSICKELPQPPPTQPYKGMCST
jgi:hypothetical protein